MSGLKLAEGEWIVVCDGAKALMLENVGDAKFPNLKTLSVRQHEDASTSEQGAERPGRVHASAGTARSSVEQTDWHQRAEEQFLQALVADLAAHVEQNKIHALTIVAPPKALGVMRPHYTEKMKGVLRNEVPHDYVKKPVHEIEKLLTA
jgi:protein required for attachment to host cells